MFLSHIRSNVLLRCTLKWLIQIIRVVLCCSERSERVFVEIRKNFEQFSAIFYNFCIEISPVGDSDKVAKFRAGYATTSRSEGVRWNALRAQRPKSPHSEESAQA